MTSNMRGFAAMVAAGAIWGNFVLVFSFLRGTPALDIIAHRVIWALAFLLIWLGIKGRFAEIIAAMRSPRELLLLLIAAVLVALNWLGFVWSVGQGYALEASLGYFIFPLFSIGLGAIFKGERINRAQWVAIIFVAIAVMVLTVGVGKLPWIALLLATSFALYGLMKSYIRTGAVLSVAIENIVLLPVALLWLFLFAENDLGFFAGDAVRFWLIAAGVLTGLALIFFSYASKTIGLVPVGMLFFINPSLQAINASFILGEPVSIWHQIAFPLIWLGCAVYCWDLWRRGVKSRA